MHRSRDFLLGGEYLAWGWSHTGIHLCPILIQFHLIRSNISCVCCLFTLMLLNKTVHQNALFGHDYSLVCIFCYKAGHKIFLASVITLDRRQLKMLILSTNIDKKWLETEILIAICCPTGDKWQSKTLFLMIFDPCSSIFNNVFDCRLSDVVIALTVMIIWY